MSKIWKQLLLFILIVACLFNIITKLTTKVSFNDEMRLSADYVKTIENNQKNNSINNQ